MGSTRPAQFEEWGSKMGLGLGGCSAIKIVVLQIDNGHILDGVITGIHAIIDIKHSCIQDSILHDVLGVELGGSLGVELGIYETYSWTSTSASDKISFFLLIFTP
jgi:hypothetical protein